jgi:hypothetical protein
MIIGPEPVIENTYFSVMYKLDGSWPYVGPQHSKKHLHLRGYKGPVKKAYVHRASKGSNPLYILFYSILGRNYVYIPSKL